MTLRIANEAGRGFWKKLTTGRQQVAKLEADLKEKETVEELTNRRLRALELQVKSHEKSARKIQPKYMEALRDRGTFEIERDRAVKALEAANARLAASNAAVQELKEKNTALEARLVEATTTAAAPGDSARADDGAEPVAAANSTTDAAAHQKPYDRIAALEKKLASATADRDFIGERYQAASSAAAQLGTENAELKGQLEGLAARASENLREVQRIQKSAEADGLRRMLREQGAIARERERELERARDELRLLRNGRRETRAGSTPRSPRLGVMSPRGGGRAGNGGTAAAPAGGAGPMASVMGGGSSAGGGGVGVGGNGPGSRGNSPAPMGGVFDGGAGSGPLPGMTLFGQQPGNGRWGHLRD